MRRWLARADDGIHPRARQHHTDRQHGQRHTPGKAAHGGIRGGHCWRLARLLPGKLAQPIPALSALLFLRGRLFVVAHAGAPLARVSFSVLLCLDVRRASVLPGERSIASRQPAISQP